MADSFNKKQSINSDSSDSNHHQNIFSEAFCNSSIQEEEEFNRINSSSTVSSSQHLSNTLISSTSSTSTSSYYKPAKKRIHSVDDLNKFTESHLYTDFLEFIKSLGDAVCGHDNNVECIMSEATNRLISVLDVLSNHADQVEPAETSLRYGNPAYRDWFEKFEFSPGIINNILGPELSCYATELTPYFTDSFGSKKRIDYGTGHETNFVAFLYCLAKIGLFNENDRIALVTKVFNKYLKLMRKIQTRYWLEPAGSHGVWGLDDYQFLSFIWGASQLINHPTIKPKHILTDNFIDADFMFFDCIDFIKQVKKGPLMETSPYIADISSVASWNKVYSGLIKMYKIEVLGKFPIMQHFLFGTILPFPE